ncbi:MAG: hypothetical protein K0R44_1545, partial [Thermomicrobiales bacterium]|nr:hypothetical protein [Thermomicrobiales bacterium]
MSEQPKTIDADDAADLASEARRITLKFEHRRRVHRFIKNGQRHEAALQFYPYMDRDHELDERAGDLIAKLIEAVMGLTKA